MLEPTGFATIEEKVEAGVATYHTLKKILEEHGLAVGLGDEGGFAPVMPGAGLPEEQALTFLIEAIQRAGYTTAQIVLGMDVAASSIDEAFDFDYSSFLARFPLRTIEDPYSEDAWDKWAPFTKETTGKVVIIGDDLVTTNPILIKKAIAAKSMSGVLIKPNQIGTLSETLEAIRLGQEAGLAIAVSHRSSETTDDFIADLAVAVGAEYLKAGAPARGERVAKYNRLLAIDTELMEGQA
jgi:enolase